MAVPFKFAKHGRERRAGQRAAAADGRSASTTSACCARCTRDNPNHGPALFMMNNGTLTPKRPSLGSWLSYGLGTENANLPGYVVLCPGRPVRFAELWSSALPAGRVSGDVRQPHRTSIRRR